VISDQPFAVVDQQPDVELDAGQLGRREPLDAFPERRASDGERGGYCPTCRDHDRRACSSTANASCGSRPG